MKKTVSSLVAMSLALCFMLSSGSVGAADMDKGMMMDNSKMMMDNGKMMMDKGKMMMDKGMKKDGKMMMKDGEMMMKHGEMMMKNAEKDKGKMVEKKDMKDMTK